MQQREEEGKEGHSRPTSSLHSSSSEPVAEVPKVPIPNNHSTGTTTATTTRPHLPISNTLRPTMSGNAYSVARQYQDWHHPEQHHLYEHDDHHHHNHDQHHLKMSEKKCMDLLNQDPTTTELPQQCENMQYIKVVLEERRTQQQQQNGKKDRVLATTAATKDKK